MPVMILPAQLADALHITITVVKTIREQFVIFYHYLPLSAKKCHYLPKSVIMCKASFAGVLSLRRDLPEAFSVRFSFDVR